MNPFIITAYNTPNYFCDRELEVSKFYNAIDNQRNIALISTRRMGKTGLIKHLEYLTNEQNMQIFVYFDIMATNNLSEFVAFFAENIFKTNSNRRNSIYKTFSKIFSAFKPSFTVNPANGETKFNLEINSVEEGERSLNAIFEYIADSKKQYIIAIDEFQQIVNYPEKNFEAILRSYIQHLNNAVFIFSGSSKEILNSMFSSKRRPFYMSSDIMHLGTIPSDKYSEFIIRHFASGKMKISQEVVDYILDLVNSHTYYVQLLCNRLYSCGIKEITIPQVYKVFLNILDENKFYFESYRNILTEYQWRLLKAIARDDNPQELLSKEFATKHNLGSTSSTATALKSLMKKEFILHEDDKYSLHDLLLSAWFRNF